MLSRAYEWYRLVNVAPTSDIIENRKAAARSVIEAVDDSKDWGFALDCAEGVVVGFDADRLGLEADRLESDVETTAADLEDTRASLARLRQDTTTRAVQHRELVRALEQERQMADVRLQSMRGQLNGDGGDLVITSPCAGTVLRMMVSTTGAVVQAGDALGEVACAGQRLQVEMTLDQQAVARVRVGQGAKLLYDAFPYQRFGVRFGNVRWVGPATVGPTRDALNPGNPQAFRALIDPTDTTINVRGEPRPLLVGMRGRVRVVTGQRTLISFAWRLGKWMPTTRERSTTALPK